MVSCRQWAALGGEGPEREFCVTASPLRSRLEAESPGGWEDSGVLSGEVTDGRWARLHLMTGGSPGLPW